MDRYSYTELKRARSECTAKAMEAALVACGNVSEAQKEVFRAHVDDLCASVFTAAQRQYDPPVKEQIEPVDSDLLARAEALKAALEEKERIVQELREKVPRMAAEATRRQLDKARKRQLDITVVAAELHSELEELTDMQVEDLKKTYEKTTMIIASANTKLDRMMANTSETIAVVERAMKRPKSAVDIAMEKSPAKLHLSLNPTQTSQAAREETVRSLRSRLALGLSTATTT